MGIFQDLQPKGHVTRIVDSNSFQLVRSLSCFSCGLVWCEKGKRKGPHVASHGMTRETMITRLPVLLHPCRPKEISVPKA